MPFPSVQKVLVVGATGATGKHVVRMLLDKGHQVVAIARSEEKMRSLLPSDNNYGDRLTVEQLSISDLTPQQYKDLTKDCDAVVSCLGHNLTMKGMWRDGYFVSATTRSLCEAMPEKCRFIMMGSDGVSNPDGSDPKRSVAERTVLFLLRWLIPPHADNEMAALYLSQNKSSFDWSVVRPIDLIAADVSEYEIFDTTHGSLFAAGTATRANVADMMTRLVVEEETWKKYKHAMPVLWDKKKPEEKPANNGSKKSN